MVVGCLGLVDCSGTRLGLGCVWGVCSSVMGVMWVGVVGEGWGCLMLCGTLVLGVCVDILFFDGWSVRMLGFFLDLGSGNRVDRLVVGCGIGVVWRESRAAYGGGTTPSIHPLPGRNSP